MKAVQVGEPGHAVVADVGEPKLRGPQDAIVKVTAAAICGADLFPLHGMTPGFDPATVLGHEFAGVITDVGDAVDLLEVGQRVVSSSMTSDGTCTHCRMGRPAQCASRALFGYSGVYPRLDGGQAEYVRVPMADRCLLKLPSAFTDEQALFLADILPTGYAAVRGRPARHDRRAGLRAAGADGAAVRVRLRRRRELAASLGAQAVSPAEATELVMARTGGLGADVVIEAAGTAGALDAALQLARGRGTVSVVGAHFEPDYKLNAGLMFERELTLRFSIGDPLADRERLMQMVLSRGLAPERVITHRLPLAEAAEAYRLFDTRAATKVVLLP